jgi:hypothetical protein
MDDEEGLGDDGCAGGDSGRLATQRDAYATAFSVLTLKAEA